MRAATEFAMLYVLLSAFFFFIIIPQCDAGDVCPNEAVLSPCTCTQVTIQNELSAPSKSLIPRRKRAAEDKITPEFSDDSSLYTTVQCLGPKSVRYLEEKIITVLDRKWVDKLIVANLPPEQGYTTTKLPSDWLRNVRIRQLEIRNTPLSGDFVHSGNPLEDQAESLYWLTASNCHLSGFLTYSNIGTIQTRGLNVLRRLNGVDFSSNHLTAVLQTAFKTPPINLTTVILSKNIIQFIEASAFQSITRLKHVDLSHNLLTSVFRNYFPYGSSVRRLEYIDISWNSLTILPTDLFYDMTSLRFINVSNNFLHSLSAQPWSVAWRNLSHIDATGNFIECNCDLLWLLPILMPPNNLTEIRPELTKPKALPGQTVIGQCSQPLPEQPLQTVNHSLISLTRNKLTC